MCFSSVLWPLFRAVQKLKRRIADLENWRKEMTATVDDVLHDISAVTALANAAHTAIAAALQAQIDTLKAQIGSEAPVTQAQLDEIHAGLTGVISTLQPVTPATLANPAPAAPTA